MKTATVYIWMPGKFYVPGIGHASLELSSTGRTDYITWSADGNPLARPVPSLAGDHYGGLGNSLNFEKDQRLMSGFFGQSEPHYAVELPTLRMSARGLRYGIDVARTREFWQERLDNPPQYAFLSRKMNCTGCVAEALNAGGLGFYATQPFNLFVQDARTLLTWVQKAQRNLQRLNDSQEQIEQTMKQNMRKNIGIVAMDIPSLGDWRKDSDEKVSFRALASRSDQIAAIDGLIERYHRPATDLVTRYALLIRMQNETYSHMTLKPQSDRRLSVIKLGATVTSVLDRMTQNNDLQALLDHDNAHSYSEIITLLNPRVFVDDNCP